MVEWRRDASELRTVWPYPVKENVVKLQVSARLKDGSIPSSELLQESNWLLGRGANLADKRAVLNIYSLGVSWTDMAVECSISVDDPDGLRRDVLPPGQDVPLSFALLLRCDNTRWRKAVTSPFESGKADLAFSLERSHLAGEIEIQPFVTLAVAPASTAGVWARRKAARVATGFTIYVRADEPLEGPGRGIDVKWVKFEDQIAGALHRLEIVDDSKVSLYLNSGYPALEPILDNRSRVRNERTILRDALFSFIAADVWLQLGDAAAHWVPEEEEELPQLYDRVLKFLSRQLGLDREVIKSYFTTASEALKRAELQTRLQNYLVVAGKAESIVLTAPTKAAGGD